MKTFALWELQHSHFNEENIASILHIAKVMNFECNSSISKFMKIDAIDLLYEYYERIKSLMKSQN